MDVGTIRTPDGRSFNRLEGDSLIQTIVVFIVVAALIGRFNRLEGDSLIQTKVEPDELIDAYRFQSP